MSDVISIFVELLVKPASPFSVDAPGKSKLKAGHVVEPLFPVDAFHMLFQFPD